MALHSGARLHLHWLVAAISGELAISPCLLAHFSLHRFESCAFSLVRVSQEEAGAPGACGLRELAAYPTPPAFACRHCSCLPVPLLTVPKINDRQPVRSHLAFGGEFLLSLNLGEVETLFPPHIPLS